jgi:hypothetical protein
MTIYRRFTEQFWQKFQNPNFRPDPKIGVTVEKTRFFEFVDGFLMELHRFLPLRIANPASTDTKQNSFF